MNSIVNNKDTEIKNLKQDIFPVDTVLLSNNEKIIF